MNDNSKDGFHDLFADRGPLALVPGEWLEMVREAAGHHQQLHRFGLYLLATGIHGEIVVQSLVMARSGLFTTPHIPFAFTGHPHFDPERDKLPPEAAVAAALITRAAAEVWDFMLAAHSIRRLADTRLHKPEVLERCGITCTATPDQVRATEKEFRRLWSFRRSWDRYPDLRELVFAELLKTSNVPFDEEGTTEALEDDDFR
jgi:hypothetical protein